MNDPLILSQIHVMQQQERSASYLCSDYLSRTQVIGPSHRHALCQWGYETIAACNGVSRSTAVAAITYFDRFLSSNTPAAERALNDVVICQLAFVTSLVIALKIHPGFTIESDFVSGVITRNAYGADEINSMELEILQSLSWKLNGPTPHDFIGYFLEVMPGVSGACLERIRSLSKTLVELAVSRYDTVMYLPSEIAFASIFCAVYHLELQLLANGLRFLQMISGVEVREDHMISLLQTMICLSRERYVALEAPPLVSRVCSPPSIMEDI
eukprot:scaffold68721_cov21-Cyclotella_meneghiniana.AAC.2